MKKDCPACQTTTVNATIPQFAAGQLNSLATSAIRSHPGYKYLIAQDGPYLDGIQSALSAAGISGEKILGFAGDQDGFTTLKAGTSLAWTGFGVPMYSYQLMDAAFRNSEGMAISPADETEPTQLVTRANANSIKLYPSLGGYAYPTNALQQFETVWHIK